LSFGRYEEVDDGANVSSDVGPHCDLDALIGDLTELLLKRRDEEEEEEEERRKERGDGRKELKENRGS